MHCTLCPRRCGASRATVPGLCGAGSLPCVARAAPHYWEEPCLSGTNGSGTVFFTGCPLGCAFCQNHEISRGGKAGRQVTPAELAAILLQLAQKGVHNLNLVTASHHRPAVQQALALARQQGLALPVVWNTGGYETTEAVKALQADVDIWLTDLKFHSPALARGLADAPGYFATATAALRQMVAQTGPPLLDNETGLMQSGVIVRLLVLPGHRQDAKQILHWLAAELPRESFLLSLMSQYTPPPGVILPKPFNRRVSSFEYNDVLDTAVSLGLTGGFAQQRGAACAEYTPPFDLTGVK